jgi:hypothetical protein
VDGTTGTCHSGGRIRRTEVQQSQYQIRTQRKEQKITEEQVWTELRYLLRREFF